MAIKVNEKEDYNLSEINEGTVISFEDGRGFTIYTRAEVDELISVLLLIKDNNNLRC